MAGSQKRNLQAKRPAKLIILSTPSRAVGREVTGPKKSIEIPRSPPYLCIRSTTRRPTTTDTGHRRVGSVCDEVTTAVVGMKEKEKKKRETQSQHNSWKSRHRRQWREAEFTENRDLVEKIPTAPIDFWERRKPKSDVDSCTTDRPTGVRKVTRRRTSLALIHQGEPSGKRDKMQEELMCVIQYAIVH
ncbi:LDLR chaperone MESD [Striga asiatica]|uniref:LDLR chaperone MESD n=1 Tax=Striga asiatica TaxID=4170 RepID=A0A5A7Q440_STRAF|nr:LDLR chaperone MESD [Striga asiatica]